jgi:hypothetical protein
LGKDMLENDGLDFREIDEAFIKLRKDGIVQIQYKRGTEINPALQVKVMAIFKEICHDRKRPFLFGAMEYVTVTKEARENAIALESVFPGSATAVIASNTAYRLTANFYLKVNRPKTPFKVFQNEEKAVAWLLNYL